MSNDIQERKITVAHLNTRIEAFITQNIHLESVWIAGECSNVKVYRSGHIYFSLKDEEAQVACVMFKAQADKLNFVPKDGLKVLLKASASFYAKEGRFQLRVSQMKEDGIGSLYETFLKWKEYFSNKGYFDANIKKPLPFLPRRCGVVTSAHGAVIRDIIHVSTRRFPGCNILLYPSAVQGEAAVPELIRGLQYLDKCEDVDVIIIGRGGGSAEDLWCFNHPDLVEAIFSCKTPVVSAVGHETDFTLCDFVADERAPTPSAAAEKVWPVKHELLLTLDKHYMSLVKNLQKLYENKSLRFSHAEELFYSKFDKFYDSLKQKLNLKIESLAKYRPQKQLEQATLMLDTQAKLLNKSMRTFLLKREYEFDKLQATLEQLSPHKVLERGYSKTTYKNEILVSAKMVQKGDEIQVELFDGSLVCTVERQIESRN